MKWLRCLVSVLFVGALPALGQTLYDAALGTPPDQQGWGFVSVPFPAEQIMVDASVQLNTFASSTVLAGYSRLAPVPLDRTNGFRVAFTLRLQVEIHNTTNRAGLSVVVLGADKRGLELAFWPERVWAQSDSPLFTQAEGTYFDTTFAFVTYELAFTATSYVLRADGKELLTGPVRDYTAFTGIIDPYETPDFLFIGDDTTSAKASFGLRRVELLTTLPPPVVSFTPPAAGTDKLTVTWPAGHKLQRATRLSPPDWADFAADPPLAVPFAGPGEFFRAVPK